MTEKELKQVGMDVIDFLESHPSGITTAEGMTVILMLAECSMRLMVKDEQKVI